MMKKTMERNAKARMFGYPPHPMNSRNKGKNAVSQAAATPASDLPNIFFDRKYMAIGKTKNEAKATDFREAIKFPVSSATAPVRMKNIGGYW